MKLNTGSREDHAVDGRRTGVTRVMVVEDEPLFRELLTSTLSAYNSIEVVAAVDNGKDAITLAEEVLPDVVLMDIEL
ncbi:MAG: response regulator, partial [Chloroflexi bacterium]|nr:response regulator [Chloroflexota bacterium]